MAVIRSYYAVSAFLSTTWQDIRAAVVGEISGSIAGGGSSDNGMATGADSDVDFSALISKAQVASIPANMPIRVQYRITDAAGDHVARSAVGRAQGVKWDDEHNAWDVSFKGIQEIIKGTRTFSPMFVRKPAARKTSASSPVLASDPSCSPMEWLLLTAGGWPAPRAAENATALFYYELDQALFSPDFVWFSGEDGWSELLQLVRAVGGQLYVRGDGVLAYRQPLSFGETAPVWTYTDQGVHDPANKIALGRFSYQRSDRKTVTEVRCTSNERRADDNQDVLTYEEQSYIVAGQQREIELQLDDPLIAVEAQAGLVDIVVGMPSIQLKHEAITIGDGINRRVAQGASGYTHTVTVGAQRLLLTITNNTSGPIVLYKLVLRGRPLRKVASFTVSQGVATPSDAGKTMDIEENVFIQRRNQANALCKMYLAFYRAMPNGEPRPTYSFSGCVFNPEIDIGKAIYATSTRFGATLERCVVINKRHSKTGHEMEFDAVPVDDLPKQSDFYVLGTTNYAGQTKRIGW